MHLPGCRIFRGEGVCQPAGRDTCDVGGRRPVEPIAPVTGGGSVVRPNPSAAAAVEASRSSWSRSSPPVPVVEKTRVLRGPAATETCARCGARRPTTSAAVKCVGSSGGTSSPAATSAPSSVGHRPANTRRSPGSSTNGSERVPASDAGCGGRGVPVAKRKREVSVPGSSTQAQTTSPPSGAAAGSPWGAGGWAASGRASRQPPPTHVFTRIRSVACPSPRTGGRPFAGSGSALSPGTRPTTGRMPLSAACAAWVRTGSSGSAAANTRRTRPRPSRSAAGRPRGDPSSATRLRPSPTPRATTPRRAAPR